MGTDISFNKYLISRKNIILIFYKNSYFNEIKINKTIFSKVTNMKSVNNSLNIFNIHFVTNVAYDGTIITNILIQKQTIQDDEDFIKFNLIALKIGNWKTIFDLGIIYEKINTVVNFSGTIKYKNNYKEIKLHCSIILPQNNLTSSVILDKLIGIPALKHILLPYSNTNNDTKLVFYPLINPMPKLKINSKNNKSQLVIFNNFKTINLPEYSGANFDSIIKKGIKVSMKTLRVTDNSG